ncbi:Uncharacterised protein [Mycobacteroides abscessus subsp. massiliense]|nr:Uncharacterised protein [Mycobacteroides abscessus subsp. massiliense]
MINRADGLNLVDILSLLQPVYIGLTLTCDRCGQGGKLLGFLQCLCTEAV